MRNHLLASVALAVLVGMGTAYGQNSGAGDRPSSGTPSDNSPGTPPTAGSGSPNAQPNSSPTTRAPRSGEQSTQPRKETPTSPNRAQGAPSDRTKNQPSEGGVKRDDTQKRGSVSEKPGQRGTESDRGNMRSNSGSPNTARQSGGANLSSEQRTKITAVIREQRVQPEAHVNINISVGTHVPKSVKFHPLPAEIVRVYPGWRGYEFFLVGQQIIVVDPRRLVIVAVLEA